MMAELRKITPEPAIGSDKVPSEANCTIVHANAIAAAHSIGIESIPNQTIGRAVNDATVLITIRSNRTL
jgi:hypothetical protein